MHLVHNDDTQLDDDQGEDTSYFFATCCFAESRHEEGERSKWTDDSIVLNGVGMDSERKAAQLLCTCIESIRLYYS